MAQSPRWLKSIQNETAHGGFGTSPSMLFPKIWRKAHNLNMLMINQNDKNNTTLPEIEAAKAIVLLHQQVDNHPESDTAAAAAVAATAMTTPNELPNDDNDDSKIQHLAKQQLIQNESASSSSSSTVPAGVAAHDHDDKETSKGFAKGDDDPKSTVTTSITKPSFKLDTQSLDVGEKKKGQVNANKKSSTMLKPRVLAPLNLDLASSPQERDDTTGITTMMTLPTSPMTCTKNKPPPVLLHSGMKRSCCSPKHDAVGPKGPTKKFKICLTAQTTTTTAALTVTAASSNLCDTNIQQLPPKPDNFIDLSMDDPSDDDDDEAIATTMTRLELDRVGDMIGDSPEMKFVHLIGEMLKGRPQETFKTITAQVMDYHSRQVGGTYKRLPKAILLQVRDRMDPSEYRGAYYAARAEWTKMYPYHNDSHTRMAVTMDQAPNGGSKYPLEVPTQEGTTGQMAQLWTDPHNNHARFHYPMAIRPGTETIRRSSGGVVLPSRNITTNQHRIPAGGAVVAVAVPPRHNNAPRYLPQNPPNRRNVAIVLQSSMRIHSPVQAMGEASTRSMATNHAHRSAGVPTRNNNNHSEHGEHHRSVPFPVVTTNRQGNRLQVGAATPSPPNLQPLSARPSSTRTPPKAQISPQEQRSVRVLSPSQPEVVVTTTRGRPTTAAYTRTAERPCVVNHPTIGRTIVPICEGTVNNHQNNNNNTSSNNKSAMQLSLRFGFALCLKQQQRIRRRSTNYVALSVEEIMAKAERKLNTMTPEERDQLWEEIKEFTEEECGM